MSDRPEDHTDPEHAEHTDPEHTDPIAFSAGPAAPASEPPLPPPPPGGGPAPTPGPSDGPWWQQPHPGQPQWGGYPSRPHDPYGYGPAQGRPTGAAAPGGPGGWQGGHWPGGPWAWNQPGGGWGQPAHPQAGGVPTRRKKGLAAAAAAVLTALALLIGIGIGYSVWNGGTAVPSASHSLTPGGTSKATATATATSTSSGATTSAGRVSSASGAPSGIATIRAKVMPGLVDINTVLRYETEEAAGTGMVLTSTGKVLTNNHVIEGSTRISVTDLGNGKTYSASVLGYTRTQDIAVIQLKGASGLKTVHVGDSSSIKVGDAVVGIGNAGGVGGEPSAAGGAVAALGQAITASDEGSLGITTEHLTGLIESNADIQPGDSGGPLVTSSGTVVGMDTAASTAQGYSFRGAVTGQGYSIPINEAISIAHQIIAGKSTSGVHIGETPFLGVYVQSVTTRTSTEGLGAGNTATFTTGATSGTTASGAVVYSVIPGTPAQGSGLAKGDLITSVAGTTVTSPGALTKIMLRYHPGDAVKVVWTASTGRPGSATVTLANGPAD
jgi:S1-C subfamily serine protease